MASRFCRARARTPLTQSLRWVITLHGKGSLGGLNRASAVGNFFSNCSFIALQTALFVRIPIVNSGSCGTDAPHAEPHAEQHAEQNTVPASVGLVTPSAAGLHTGQLLFCLPPLSMQVLAHV